MPAVKALFFSFIACARNWRPFLTYGLGVAFISAILPGIVLGIVGAASAPLQTPPQCAKRCSAA